MFEIYCKGWDQQNVDKCVFATSDMQVLGHWICSGKIMPTDEKIKAIVEWKRPKTKRQLKSFLGTVNFFMISRSLCFDCKPREKTVGKSQPDTLVWNTRTGFWTVQKWTYIKRQAHSKTTRPQTKNICCIATDRLLQFQVELVYRLYKSSSHVVTSHHPLVQYSIISLSASSSHHCYFPLVPVARDWLPRLGFAN